MLGLGSWARPWGLGNQSVDTVFGYYGEPPQVVSPASGRASSQGRNVHRIGHQSDTAETGGELSRCRRDRDLSRGRTVISALPTSAVYGERENRCALCFSSLPVSCPPSPPELSWQSDLPLLRAGIKMRIFL